MNRLRRYAPGRGSEGFTLLEILLSLAIMGLLIVALNTFVFSMSELWGRNADARLFDAHINAVTHFIEQEFLAATLPSAARANSTPVAFASITPQNSIQTNLLTFDLLSGSRVLSWPDVRLPEVTCSLLVRDNQGLFLLWHSRLETRYADDPPREVLISPFVTAIKYDYYDDNFKRWTTYTTVLTDASGAPETPQRLRLVFQYGKHTPRETTVPIPAAGQGMPNS
jgi:prepilin-type N-terminal cleavage/methylation domain-containing protein